MTFKHFVKKENSYINLAKYVKSTFAEISSTSWTTLCWKFKSCIYMHCMRHYFLRYLKVSPKWKISDSFFHEDHFELKVVLFFFLETTGNDWKLTKFSQRHVTNSWFFSSWGKSFIHFKISRSTFILWVIKFFVDFFQRVIFFIYDLPHQWSAGV